MMWNLTAATAALPLHFSARRRGKDQVAELFSPLDESQQ